MKSSLQGPPWVRSRMWHLCSLSLFVFVMWPLCSSPLLSLSGLATCQLCFLSRSLFLEFLKWQLCSVCLCDFFIWTCTVSVSFCSLSHAFICFFFCDGNSALSDTLFFISIFLLWRLCCLVNLDFQCGVSALSLTPFPA